MKLTQNKTHCVLFRLRQDRNERLCTFSPEAFRGDRERIVRAITAIKQFCIDFHILVKPSGMGEVHLNGDFLAYINPEGDDGWKKITYEMLKQTFPAEHAVAMNKYGA